MLSVKAVFSDFSHVRLVLWVIMQQTVTSVNLIGPSCSSWGLPNRGTSMRNFINWKGNEQYPYVAAANRMVSRSFGFMQYYLLVFLVHVVHVTGSILTLWRWEAKGCPRNIGHHCEARHMGS